MRCQKNPKNKNLFWSSTSQEAYQFSTILKKQGSFFFIFQKISFVLPRKEITGIQIHSSAFKLRHRADFLEWEVDGVGICIFIDSFLNITLLVSSGLQFPVLTLYVSGSLQHKHSTGSLPCWGNQTVDKKELSRGWL